MLTIDYPYIHHITTPLFGSPCGFPSFEKTPRIYVGQDVAEEIELMVTELSGTLVLAPWADVFRGLLGWFQIYFQIFFFFSLFFSVFFLFRFFFQFFFRDVWLVSGKKYRKLPWISWENYDAFPFSWDFMGFSWDFLVDDTSIWVIKSIYNIWMIIQL